MLSAVTAAHAGGPGSPTQWSCTGVATTWGSLPLKLPPERQSRNCHPRCKGTGPRAPRPNDAVTPLQHQALREDLEAAGRGRPPWPAPQTEPRERLAGAEESPCGSRPRPRPRPRPRGRQLPRAASAVAPARAVQRLARRDAVLPGLQPLGHAHEPAVIPARSRDGVTSSVFAKSELVQCPPRSGCLKLLHAARSSALDEQRPCGG